MEKFINKYFIDRSISQEELYDFIYKYCEFKEKPCNSQELMGLAQALQMIPQALEYACKEVADKKYDLQVTAIYDKNGQFISYILNNKK